MRGTRTTGPAPATGSAGAPPASTVRSLRARTVRGWGAVVSVAVGIFALMTSELLPVGLLTPIGSEFGVSAGTAGLMVTVPGIVAAISAPLITVLAGRIDRRIVLCALIGVMGAANLLSSLADHFSLVLAARFLVGVAVGGFWSIAGGIALRLVPEHHVGRAMAVIFGGVETATVLGVPAGTYLGALAGWRTAFAAVGLLGLAALVCMVFLLPTLPAVRVVPLSALPRLLRNRPAVRRGLALTLLLVTGHFLAWTYLRPILEERTGADGGTVGTLLLAFGVAGLVGNVVAGFGAARHPRGAPAAIGATTALAVCLLPVVNGPVGAVPVVLAWGLAYGAVPVTLQTWILRAAPGETEAATSLHVCAFNFSIALGAWGGGLVVDRSPVLGVVVPAALLVVMAVPVAMAAGRFAGVGAGPP
ncbi:MFS transporter [Streptomyces calidiresistens]|uniref:MFS transporter n=1 Tax=Streptomyces calidiresistens TaxID=1485586 RepID=A0A7W3T7N5_9ACTN|nr:MFS transporter [Streptomyces calidiresistens]MBB0232472.1 MFS transporter [Streptomyces calidiresistens]